MQDHPAIAPRAVEECANLSGGGGGLVYASRETRGRTDRDAAAPRISRLSVRRGIVRIRIGQRVSCRHVHEQERIEQHAPAARLQFGDCRHHAVVRRRAAVRRPPVDPADQMRVRPRHAARAPGFGIGEFGRGFDAGLDLDRTGPQIVAEPADHQRHGAKMRRETLQLIKRGFQIGLARSVVGVLRGRGSRAVVFADHIRGVDEFARARNQRHTAELVLQRRGIARRDRADDFELQLRNAVAEGGQRHVFEDDITDAAISGCVALSFGILDRGIAGLRFIARIDARGVGREVDQGSIGPHPADLGDGTGAEAHSEGYGIEIVGFLDGGRRQALAARRGGGGGFLEAAGPQKLPRHAHATVKARDRRAFGGRLDGDV